MDLEKEYWNVQLKKYDDLKYNPEIKYESWQPARWSSNKSAIELISKYVENIESSIEIGAGSGAFSLELYRKYKNKVFEIDRSEVACKYGKKIAQDMNIPVIYNKGDLFKIKESNIADIVLSLGVIEHYNDKLQKEFIKKCIQLTKNYILIAIPNQESSIFKNYVNWSNKNGNIYQEKHENLSLDKLMIKMEEEGLNILYADGFQVFLSEGKFWNEMNLEKEPIIQKLKRNIQKINNDIGKLFPNYDFKFDDINMMAEIECNLEREERMQNSFMSFVLASVKKEQNDRKNY